ncbi:hypothetical protein [Acinetobacter baumannii]|uniref:hypothetical protein n=1 Tax=Acinetobacter baumannii TaxID=470 RepID=UPI0038B6AFC2
MGINKSQKFVFVLVMIILLIFIWGLFPLFFKWLMIGIGTNKTNLEDFGALGDIYGSLNTLFTSATLLIVIYSAYLQRQANNDVRGAMAEQLEQAREATEEQLKQARESITQQLNLAESTHKAQIKETIYSNFLNTYNSLMNYKLAKYNTIQVFIDGRVWHSEEIFKEIALSFLGEQQIFELQLTGREIGDLYNQTLDKIAGIDKGLNEINSYFLLYESIYELIKNSDISEEEKKFFRKTTSNTMSNHEQLTLLWASVDILDCHELVKDTSIFSHFYSDDLMPFLVNFFEKSCFSHPDILLNWDKFKNNQNPA